LQRSTIIGLALACLLPSTALADSRSAAISDPLEQLCFPHTFCTPDLEAAAATYDPVAGTVTVAVTFKSAVPGQQDPGLPGYEIKVALASSATNGHCGNIQSLDISSGLAQGDVLLRGFVAGEVANSQWAQGDLAIGGSSRRLEVARTLSADGRTLEYGFQSPKLVGSAFWCFEVSENPVTDESKVDDATQYVMFPGAQPEPHVSDVSARSVTAAAAQISATVDPDGSSASTHVEFGKTTAYGSRTTESAALSVPAPVSTALTGLHPGTTYHYRVVATGANGSSTSPDQTFVTRGGAPLALVVTGSLRRGSIARCSRTASSPAVALSGFRWLRGGAAIAGATGSTYRIATRDLGSSIRCSVALVDPDRGSLHAISAARKIPNR
jgi:hypothetical protein